jgi:hypothetical protein
VLDAAQAIEYRYSERLGLHRQVSPTGMAVDVAGPGSQGDSAPP